MVYALAMKEDDGKPLEPAEMIAVLREFQARIPHFRQLTPAQAIAIRKAATLDRDWVNLTIHALSASPAVQTTVGATHEELLAEIDDLNRWGAVESELYALIKGVAAAILIRRHRVGLKALQIYGLARQLIRQPEHADLIPIVEQLQQMNKLGKRKKKKDEE
jgi:hypothetical protein